MIARIYSINLSWKDNYLSFDDSDSMTDYFHGYSLGINRAIDLIKKDGGHKISVSVTNDDPKIPALKRIQQIAKACGYTITDTSHEHTFHGYRDEEVKRFVYGWVLTATSERLKVLDAEDAEAQRKQEEAEAYRKTPAAKLARLKGELHQAQHVTAVLGAQGFYYVTDIERAAQVAKIEAERRSCCSLLILLGFC